ncbi:GPW/gp25 family protein [Thiomicrorhabdus cannonii]|uniref:GPW/gp25 family protein n=1 Tax=Thiomicrorhabdus cannonii TaxID=2748011 RepID=UPI001C4AF1B9|nr:GPW/gp25 family protein [Thiomicrorhabdus cannonii]
MSRTTGKAISGMDHLRQRIADVLTTPIGTRVMRRDYGSRVFELIDNPTNERFKVEMTMAVYEAFKDPVNGLYDLVLTSVTVTADTTGQSYVDIEGKYVPSGEMLRLEQISL